jgi:hypothetical protein
MHIMRTNFLILVLALCGAAFAATPAQTTTYVDGNLDGLTPKTGGTLTFTDDKAMYLHTGLTTVAVTYSGVTHAELGAIKQNPHDAPFYKFWDRRQSKKTATQLLIVNFKNDEGDDKTMTLELAQAGASSVLTDLQTRTGKNFGAPATPQMASAKKVDPMGTISANREQSGNWWGDQWWKTPRNADQWTSDPKVAGTPQQ